MASRGSGREKRDTFKHVSVDPAVRNAVSGRKKKTIRNAFAAALATCIAAAIALSK